MLLLSHQLTHVSRCYAGPQNRKLGTMGGSRSLDAALDFVEMHLILLDSFVATSTRYNAVYCVCWNVCLSRGLYSACRPLNARIHSHVQSQRHSGVAWAGRRQCGGRPGGLGGVPDVGRWLCVDAASSRRVWRAALYPRSQGALG